MIHDDLLWKKTGTELETVALDELLDRRLHTVEQLYCNVNSGGVQISPIGRTWKVAGPGSRETTTAAADADGAHFFFTFRRWASGCLHITQQLK